MENDHVYIAIDLKSYYASCECADRKFDPLTTNLVVADMSRTEKTICLAVSPSLKAHGVPGRPRLFEVIQKVKEINAKRLREYRRSIGDWKAEFKDKSFDAEVLASDPSMELDYFVAPPRMARYMEVSSKIYGIYLKYVAKEDVIDHAWGYEPVTVDYIKQYRPESNSLGSGQVLHRPYKYEEAKIIVREMADDLSLELLRKGIATAKIELYIGFDRESLVEANGRYKYKDDPQGRYYTGKVSLDYYGRNHPKHANGNRKLPFPTSSTKMIVDAALSIFEEKVDPLLLVRRVNIAAMNVISDSEARQIQASHQEEQALGQMDLFTDYVQQDAEQEEQKEDLERERRLQEAVLTIKDKFGRNAVLKGTNFLEGARSRERHNEVGGHKA